MISSDVVIVGGGPAGLSAALMLGRCRHRVVVVDAGNPRNVRASQLNGFLSRDGSVPAELLAAGRREIDRYDVQLLHDVVTSVEAVPFSDEQSTTGFMVITRSGETIFARKILFATGLCDAIPEFDGALECYGISMHHCPYCDGWEHRDQHLIAYSDAPESAVALGLALRNWSQNVSVLTNGHAVSAELVLKLEFSSIRVCTQPIARITHTAGQLEAVILDTGERYAADALFFHTSKRPACNLPGSLGCDYSNENEYAYRSQHKQRSSVPGVFLAGDADGDVQFVIVAAAEGAIAAVAIHEDLVREYQNYSHTFLSEVPT